MDELTYRVLLGSTNPVKAAGVRRALHERTDIPWHRASIHGLPAPSGVASQPTSLAETLTGAQNRVFWMEQDLDSTYDVQKTLLLGIESGLFPMGPHVLDLCIVYARWGHRSVTATSSSFLVPGLIIDLAMDPVRLDAGLTLDDACREAGLTDSPRLGHAEGLVGLLSGGLLTREAYTYEGVRNALFSLWPKTEN